MLTSENNRPIISIVIPCRNEENFIEKCIYSLLGQEGINGEIEILVADGMSNDKTREIVTKIAADDRRVKLLDNIQLSTPHALNMGIKNANGEYVAILGAHSDYSKSYLASCLNILNKYPDVSCAGGPIESLGRNDFAKATAIAMSSYIGVGNANHRFPNYEGYAEMACFPVFRKEVFDKFGLYDETLIKNQDDEFCFRINKNGGKVFISSSAKSNYYVRESPKELFKQYFDYGFWRVAVLKKHKVPISYRQQIPILFFLTMLILLILGFVTHNFILSAFFPITYISLISIFGFKTLFVQKFSVAIRVPLAVFILHFSYACGFFIGIIKFLILNKSK